jgi:uncharacterized protein
MSEPFSIDAALKIGTVFEVSGSALKAALTPGLDELSRLHRGRVYGIGQIGSLVKIHFGRKTLFASVRALRLQTEEEAAAVAEVSSERRVLEADLLGEGTWIRGESRLDFTRGLSGSALPMQDIYLLTDEETRHVYGSLEKARDGKTESRVSIGTYTGPRAVECFADIDKMFSQHCAILGSTGSGKSSAVAAILRSVLEHKPGNIELRPRIVLIDPHGEYGQALGDRAVVYRAYDALGHAADDGQRLSLPYWLMSSDEFRSLVIGKTEFEATSQANTVYKALGHARMVAAGLIQPAREWVGKPIVAGAKPPEEPRPVRPENEAAIASFDRDKPIPFSLTEFRRHIEWEQCVRIKKGDWERVTDSEWHDSYASILNKLRVLESDGRIKFLMKNYEPADPDLKKILAQFVGDQGDKKDLRIVDISGLPNEVAGPLTAAIARLLFQYKLHETLAERQSDPILLVCEEAHRYVPDRGEAQYAAAQNAIRRIAREGRKYGLGLLLVSQRPSDVEATVLSQCNSWIVLRLTNSADQAHVARMLPDALGGMIALLSMLPRQEALFVGEAAALPARIKLRTLLEEQLPRSTDIAFAAGWKSPLPNPEGLNEIANRMAGQ